MAPFRIAPRGGFADYMSIFSLHFLITFGLLSVSKCDRNIINQEND